MSSDVDSNSSTLDGAATPLPPGTINAARKVVASRALSVDDCRLLLEALDIERPEQP